MQQKLLPHRVSCTKHDKIFKYSKGCRSNWQLTCIILIHIYMYTSVLVHKLHNCYSSVNGDYRRPTTICILCCVTRKYGNGTSAKKKASIIKKTDVCFNSEFLPPACFEKRWEVLFWGTSPFPPTFRLTSQLLLKLAFLNLPCAIYMQKQYC